MWWSIKRTAIEFIVRWTVTGINEVIIMDINNELDEKSSFSTFYLEVIMLIIINFCGGLYTV